MKRKNLRKAGRALLVLLAILILLVLSCIALLFAVSPGYPASLCDADGERIADSINRKMFVEINGVKQGMFIRGKNRNNPVLLLLHGGPGMPEYFLAEQYPTGLEDLFTVCYWEQRGAGISFDPKADSALLTSEQLIDDTIALTNYLRKRFNQDKIYLMAHSAGTYIGIKAAQQESELYAAYIGIGQIANQAQSERLAYSAMLEQFVARGDERMVKRLEAAAVLTSDEARERYTKSLLRDEAMHKLGIGTMHKMDSVLTGIFFPVFGCRAYTLREKINIWRGKALSQQKMRSFIDSKIMKDEVPSLNLPVYFFGGAYDYTVNTNLAKEYLNELNAPIKGFYTFAQSAHSPSYEEPERLMQIMREDVLRGQTELADKN